MSPLESDSAERSSRQLMSALADGQADAADDALRRWSSDPEARRAWRDYHLIGDVLRSDDFAQAARRDDAFLARLNERLAREPVVLRPARPAGAAVAPATGRRATMAGQRRWAMAAAAAGVMAVGGTVMVLRGSEGSSPALVQSGTVPADSRVATVMTAGPAERAQPAGQQVLQAADAAASAGTPLGDPQWLVMDGRMVRDARLDAYLRAHRGTWAARPGAVPVRVENVVFER